MDCVLAIESSCDETAASVIKDRTTVASSVIASQIKVHTRYGGVVPELASRMHAECIHAVIERACDEAQVSFKDLTAIAVTMGPGLEGALLVGISVAKTLSLLLDIPLIPVNHLHGHIYAHKAQGLTMSFPCVCLIVSGGHTELVLMSKEGSFEKVGKTRDDAAGEVLDKVARYLSLGYPGGPLIEKQAKLGDKTAFSFPIPMKQTPFEFSFSGLKTAAIECIDSLDDPKARCADFCASFQEAIIKTLVFKSLEACHLLQADTLLIAGGVTANQALQAAFKQTCAKDAISCITVEPSLCTDNAAMIGLAATHLSDYYGLSHTDIMAKPQLRL